MRERYEELRAVPDYVTSVLAEGAAKAQRWPAATLDRAMRAAGLLRPRVTSYVEAVTSRSSGSSALATQ